MPQKKSSQLYSVSPKSYVRAPKRKRKPKKGLYVGFITLLVVLGASLLIALYLYASGNQVVSPLPVKIGERLQMLTTEKSDVELQRLLKKSHILYTSVTPAQDGYIVMLNKKQQVLLSKKKDLASQISSLQVILPRLTMEGREFRKLDMRYEKPVVVYGD